MPESLGICIGSLQFWLLTIVLIGGSQHYEL